MGSETKAESNVQPPESTPKPNAWQRAKPAPEGQGICVTEKAAEQIKAILTKDNQPDTMYLYVGVKGGGCSGLQYVLDLRDEAHAPIGDTDEVFESHGLVIACDLKSYVVGNMSGTTIDYQDNSLMGTGFTFNNPNAKTTCGCGASYSA